MMRLTVRVPTEVVVDEEASRIVAEAANGFFGLLPRHVDFVTALVPGILVFTDRDGRDQLVAVDEGVLVKCGPAVQVSVLNAVRGATLAALQETVGSRFRRLDEEQQSARNALARLEAGALRRFLELEEHAHGL